MPVATPRVEVDVRELKNNLSRYPDRVSDGLEIVVTERGRPVARLLRVDETADRRPRLGRARAPAPDPGTPPAAADRRLGHGERPRHRPAPVTTYVDTSVLVKVLVDEPGTDRARRLRQVAEELASVTLVAVEARAALAAARRGKRLTPARHRRAVANLGVLLDQMGLVGVGDELIEQAGELAESASLRGHDAVHLAGVLMVEATVLASADKDLCGAAERLGLHIANPLAV